MSDTLGWLVVALIATVGLLLGVLGGMPLGFLVAVRVMRGVMAGKILLDETKGD